MALIKCAECGREVSDKAATCPGCGCPIAPTVTSAPSPDPSPTTDPSTSAPPESTAESPKQTQDVPTAPQSVVPPELPATGNKPLSPAVVITGLAAAILAIVAIAFPPVGGAICGAIVWVAIYCLIAALSLMFAARRFGKFPLGFEAAYVTMFIASMLSFVIAVLVALLLPRSDEPITIQSHPVVVLGVLACGMIIQATTIQTRHRVSGKTAFKVTLISSAFLFGVVFLVVFIIALLVPLLSRRS